MNLCFNRLWDEFSLSKNVVDLIPMEEDETQGEILCFLDSGTFFMESNQESRRWSSVFDVKKDPPVRMGDLLSLLDRKLFCCRQIAAHPGKFRYWTFSLPTSINPSFIPSGKRNCKPFKKKNSFPLGIVENVFIRVFSKEKKKPKLMM